MEQEGKIWFENLQDSFHCECGKTKIDLRYIKENLHGLLMKEKLSSNFSMTHLYDQSALNSLCHNFKALLDRDPSEEEVQQFIKNNPLILHQFSPINTFFKKPILNKYQTDTDSFIG